MASLTLKHLKKRYQNGYEVMGDVSLNVENKEILVLLGPSGSGKTTLLRMLMGTEIITDGEAYLDGELINDVEPADRQFAMLFQNYALYPSLTVYENLAFGLKLRKVGEDEIEERVMDTARILNLTHLLKRKPKVLSDVQKHRLALGRAIIWRPKMILLNEPYSRIESKYHRALWNELVSLQQRLGITMLYVTNDQEEAATVASRIAIINKGIIEQVGTPEEILNVPVNKFVAAFYGAPSMRFEDALCKETDGKLSVVIREKEYVLPEEKATVLMEKGYAGKEVIVGIRQEETFEEIEAEEGRITGISERISMRLDNSFDINQLHIFDKETEEAIVH